MKQLEKLIQQFCPNGVTFKRLGDIASITRGGNFQKKDYIEQGFPCIHYGQIYTKYNLFVTETISHISNEKAEQQKKAEPGDIIMAVTSENIEDVCKCIAWLGDSKVAVSGHAAIIHHSQNPKFLSYYLNSSLFYNQKLPMVQGTKVIEVSPEKLKKIILPVPPLEVQQEIVRILDQFTELTAELTAELTTREMQYKYYREKLLSLGEEIPVKQLGDICNVTAGGTPSKKNREYWDKGTIKWLSSTVCKNKKTVDEITDYITPKGIAESSAKIMGAGTTLVALVGATIGKVAFLPFEAAINQNIAGIFPKNPEELLPSYIYYSCTMLYPKFLVLTQGTKLAMANIAFVRGLKIPVPPLPEQRRIVSILDRFDALCNDLTSGLPAEIEARQKQYEYYRDKLLTFPERKNQR